MVCEGKCVGRSPEDKPFPLTRCHSCGLSLLYETLEEWISLCGQAYNLIKDIKGKIYFLYSHLTLLSFYGPSFHVRDHKFFEG